MEYKLIIDQGNTALKLFVFKGKKLVDKTVGTVSKIDDLIKLYSIQKFICSTVASTISLPDIDGISFSVDTQIPIENQYNSKESLGLDRLALAVGANLLFPKQNVLVVDAGTCLTFDLLFQGAYLGGNISPGLQMRFKALSQQTYSLPLIEPQEMNAILGRNTVDSISSGVINGMLNEIDGVVQRYIEEYGPIKVVLTGGDSKYFDNDLKSPIFVDPDLLAKGLNEILDFNENN